MLNMKELLGTSYYFLRQYFGKDVQTTDYDEFIPQSLKEKVNIERQESGAIVDSDKMVEMEEEITGIQTIGNSVLKNKNGDEIAGLTFTELPTIYSSMAKTSVDLQMVPGKMISNKGREV